MQLLRDPARRKAMGEAARKRVSRDYDMTALERSIAGAFQGVQQSIRASRPERHNWHRWAKENLA